MLSSFDILLIGASFIIMVFGFITRYKMWRQGKPEEDIGGHHIKRIIKLIEYLIAHRKILKYWYRGTSHLFIFWGFIVPFIVVIIAQFKPTMPMWTARFLSLLLDFAGFTAIVGTVVIIISDLRNSQRCQKDTFTHLWIFLAILVTGFLAEGVRLTITESYNFFSPVGLAFSFLMPDSPILLKILLRIHFLLALFFLAYLPFSNLRHIVSATLNVYYQKIEPRGIIKPILLEGDYFGIGSVCDFTWKQLLDSDACVKCRRCDDNCPAYLAGHPLSPQGIVEKIAQNMEENYAHKPFSKCEDRGLYNDNGTIGGEDIWSCTSCMACVQSCPVFVEHLDKIIGMRRYSTLTESKFPAEYKQIFKNLEIFGDSFGEGRLTREDWLSNLEVNKIYEKQQQSNIEWLFWVGCVGALYDERAKRVILETVRVLDKAGVNFGILGKEELCCGDPARRMGNEYLFQKLAKKNIETFEKYGIRKIVTNCPHGFNVFRNEYPQFGGNFEVVHTTELVKNLINEGKFTIKSKIDSLFTYHDPCYLGRYNDIYQVPREILDFVLASDIEEMRFSKETSFCCGAGGGNFWRGKITGRRIEILRIEQAVATKTNGVITSCPFCEIMFDSAVKQKGLEYSFKVLDIMELINQIT